MKLDLMNSLVAAAHTPFHSDGSLALEVVPLQAADLVQQGIGTVFISGSTGEGHSLTCDERVRLFAAWAEAGVAYQLKVVAHVGGNCLQDAARLASAAGDYELAAISALAPSYYKPATLECLVECCKMIVAAAPGLPFYYYDIPVLTGVEFSMTEFLAMAQQHLPSLAGIKFTCDDLAAYREVLATAGSNYEIPWGVDEMLLDARRCGATGAVGSSYNFASVYYRRMWQALDNGEYEEAEHWQQHARKLIERLAKVGYLGAAKALMGWRGVPVGPPRLPIATPSADVLERLRDALEASFPEVLQGQQFCP